MGLLATKEKGRGENLPNTNGYYKRVMTNSPLCSPERERLMQLGQQAPGAAGSWGMPFTELSGKSSETGPLGTAQERSVLLRSLPQSNMQE